MGCGVSSMMNADRMDAPTPSHGGRMVHNRRDRDDNDYPGSPSFKIYFKQNGTENFNNNQGEIDGVKSMPYNSRTPPSITKGSKKEKNKQGKKTSSRMVTPKHLLNMGYCCSSQDVGFQRLPEKSMA